MIYNTNRTTSLSEEITVDVNESYFGVGALDFMQKNAIEEFALFEAAIKSDIDEVLIGESASELESLNEGFVQSAKEKLVQLWTDLVEMITSVLKSWAEKFDNFLKTRVDKFVADVSGKIDKIPADFSYEGKAIKLSDGQEIKWNSFVTVGKSLYTEAQLAKTPEDIKKVIDSIDMKVAEFNAKKPRKKLDECFEPKMKITASVIEDHFDFLKKARNDIKKDKESMNTFKKDAADQLKQAKKLSKENKNADEFERSRYNTMVKAAAAYKNCLQTVIKDIMFFRAEELKVAMAVVTKGIMMGTKEAKKAEKPAETKTTNEAFEIVEDVFGISEAMVDAMIESSNYEIEQLFEEMSEAAEVEDEVEAEFKEEE